MARLLAVLALLVSAFAPALAEAAQPCVDAQGADACIAERTYGPAADCSAPNGVAGRASSAFLGVDDLGFVFLSGYSFCRWDQWEDRERTGAGHGVVLQAATYGDLPRTGLWTSWTWARSDDSVDGQREECRVIVEQSAVGSAHEPCPAGLPPPNPGWGRLLP